MGNKQIRIGQLIAPFGPGSLYTDRRGVPLIVCGLDHWFFKWDQTLGIVPCESRAEFERTEPRLSSLLHVDRFCVPPDYRHVRRGASAPPNAMLNVPSQRFPCWYRQTRSGEMRRFNLHTTRIDRPAGGGRWQPVRFVSVCAGGHLSEFPWKEWIGCQCADDGSLTLTDRGGSELSSIRIECSGCPTGSSGRRGRTLSGTTIKPDVALGEQSAFQQAGIVCPGDRPWLGEGANEPQCNQPLIGALINQINLYFPRTISAIALPDLQPQSETVANLRNEIELEPSLGVARTLWNMGNRAGTVAMIQVGLVGRGIAGDSAQVEQALESLFDPSGAALPAGANSPTDPESELLAFRRAEFNILRNEVNDPAHVPNLRVIPTTTPRELTDWLAKVNLVERLRETKVFYGFDRLEQDNSNSLVGMPETAMRQLFRNPPSQPQDRWLPAIEVFGEGIYFELDEHALLDWQASNAAWLANRLDDGFIARLGGIFQTLPPLNQANRNWGSRYLLVHGLAHILINQLVFECGYSTASLRERLYISVDPSAPMAGFLIYTSAGDSDGTLGGLVRLGRPERLGAVLMRALERASWCSADPVCSENLGGQGSKLANVAACHACVLLPETSCETVNQGLDRAMVVGTPDGRDKGFLSALLLNTYSLA
ncbi:MAG TPA: DUF1998 domain-containing protein [Pyrinomonadaceae bacterium]|nr:DUF1998 domain-containing protein [Pyrinomonadaceae bacterium]